MQNSKVQIMLRQYGFVTGSKKQFIVIKSIRCYHFLQTTHGISLTATSILRIRDNSLQIGPD